MSAGDKLPPKRKAFAEHWVRNGFNGTKAYKAAGYKGNDRVAAPEASRLTRNPKVMNWIDELLSKGQHKQLTPEFAKAYALDFADKAKEKKDFAAMGRAAEICMRATGAYQEDAPNELSMANVLKALKDTLPNDVLLALAEEHGVDPESLGITTH